MPEISNISEKSGIDRDYLMSFGPIEEYIKVVRENRPNRWKNLAKRAFLQRPTLKYSEMFRGHDKGKMSEAASKTMATLDEIVDELNQIRLTVATDNGEVPFEDLERLYEKTRRLIFTGESL